MTMNIIQRIARNLMNMHPNSSGVTIDFSKMTIEDAIMLMTMTVSSDGRKDMKDILVDMDATRRRKRDLREAATHLREAAPRRTRGLTVR